jgi:hypothetical protein
LRTKILPPIVLPVDVYTRLERQARANERDALQEARWLLKRALATEAADADRPTETAATLAATT